MTADVLKVVGLMLAIIAPIGAGLVTIGKIERAETDVINRITSAIQDIEDNRDSDARQWQLITQLRVDMAKLQVSSQCR